MQTETIPVEQWIAYFDGFSRSHVGWLATIEVLDVESGPQLVAEDLPLQGISFDSKGSRPSTVEVSASDGIHQQVTHVIDLPLHIHQSDELSGTIDLQIEPARGPVTLVHLSEPVASEA